MLLKNISDGMEKGRLKTKRWRIIPDSRTNRKQNMTSEKPALPVYLDNIRIILTRTSHPANIGSAARAMKTMGLHKLTIVAPQSDGNTDDGKSARIRSRASAIV